MNWTVVIIVAILILVIAVLVFLFIKYYNKYKNGEILSNLQIKRQQYEINTIKEDIQSIDATIASNYELRDIKQEELRKRQDKYREFLSRVKPK